MELEVTRFWTAFFAAVSAFYPQELDPGDTPQPDVRPKYDFIIVGGGAAGCVLANRLTENPYWSVLLIEAGGAENWISDTPIFEMANRHTDRDWNYTTVKQKRACLARDGICEYPRGHVLGGGSTINGMMYVRGNRADYDDWVSLGCTGWSWKEVLPYFIKSENNTEPSLYRSPYHGRNGYQSVQYPRYVTALRDEYIRAGEEFGWRKMDYNGAEQANAIDYVQFVMKGPSRASTSKSFLLPVSHRKNLHILQRSMVSKILIEDTKATGVEYHRNGEKFKVFAEKEVIISAGAIDTPKLLMLSGIGPRKELEKNNIKVLADLPVGKDLQDHPLVPIQFKINKPYTIRSDVWRTNESIYEYAKERKGPLTTSGGEAMAFFNPLNASGLPSFQIMWHSFVWSMGTQREDLLNVVSAVVYPLSRGSVRLKSNDYRDPPLIDPNYFAEEEDLATMRKGLERLFDYMKTPTMSRYSPEVSLSNHPKCEEVASDVRKLVACMTEYYSQTVYHPVGTAKMGHPRDRRAVVSPNLMVRGFQNLRVIDASVMPTVPRANTLAPTIMVAEKGADIVKAAHGRSNILCSKIGSCLEKLHL